jgi:hypothetical protein
MSIAEPIALNDAKKYGTTPLDRVKTLTDVIRAGGDKAQELRHVPKETIDALIDAGLFRFTLPTEVGGENASVRETIEVLEAISAIDASVGWNVMLGSEINAMAVGGMDPELTKEVYIDNPRVVMCGGVQLLNPTEALRCGVNQLSLVDATTLNGASCPHPFLMVIKSV